MRRPFGSFLSIRATAGLAAVLVAAASVLVAGVVQQRPAGANGPVPATGTQLRVAHSGKCLNVAHASTADRAPVIQYDCVGAANERWLTVPLDNGSYQLVAEHSGKCLNVSGGGSDPGAPLIQYRCVGAQNERWTPINRRNATPFFLTVGGMCANVAGASTANGARVIQYSCVEAANGVWSGTPGRPAVTYAAGPVVALQPVPGAPLHLAFVDEAGGARHGTTVPPSTQVQWSDLPRILVTGRPALLAAGRNVQWIARGLGSDVYGQLPGDGYWKVLGGPVRSEPAAGTNGPAVAIGVDGQLWWAPDDGVHLPFLAFRPAGGGGFVGGPAVAPARTGIQVFVVDTTDRMFTANLLPDGTPIWTYVGAGVVGTPGVAALPGYRYAVTGRSPTGEVLVKISTAAGWPSSWTALPGVPGSGPPAIQLEPGPSGRLTVLARGADGLVKASTETAAGSGTFGPWTAATPASDVARSDPTTFSYQETAGGPVRWGFAVRAASNGAVLLYYAAATTGTGFTRTELAGPR